MTTTQRTRQTKHLQLIQKRKSLFLSKSKKEINILFQNQPQPSDSVLLSPILVSCLLFFMALIFTFYYTKRWTKIFDTVFFSLISLSGILFVFMWAGTDHFVTHKNMNLLWANPLYILVIFNLYLEKNGKYLLFLLPVFLRYHLEVILRISLVVVWCNFLLS